jgi:hypothetical protein
VYTYNITYQHNCVISYIIIPHFALRRTSFGEARREEKRIYNNGTTGRLKYFLVGV